MTTVVPFRHLLQLPLVYASECKRKDQADQRFLRDNADDLTVMLLAFALFNPSPFFVILSITCLHVSFWAIYEAGYFQNDLVALRHEVDPKVPQSFDAFRSQYSEVRAWLWAGLFAVAGAAFATAAAGLAAAHPPPSGPRMVASPPTFAPAAALVAAAVWLVLLALMRMTFHLYNHIDKMSRVYLYLPLQLMKYTLPAGFFTPSPAGAALLAAQILRRWLPYLQYRLTGMKKDVFPARIVRFMIFLMIMFLLLLSGQGDTFVVQGGVMAAFLFLRSWNQFRLLLQQAKWVQDDTWKGALQHQPEVRNVREDAPGYRGKKQKLADRRR